tara:strand:+ start:7441 stop:8532 length:1092 start_codon:yes stop_codon:yes gene_type:complete
MIEKINLLTACLEDNNLDAIVLVPGSNFRYFTNGDFHMMERPINLIISKFNKPIAILPNLEVDSFKKLKIDSEIISWKDKNGYMNAFKEASLKLGSVKNIGIEGQRIRFFEVNAIKEVFKNSCLIDAHHILASFRIKKNKDEINKLRIAIEISERALKETLTFVSEGKTEKEIKNLLIQNLFKFGSDGIAFDPIVLAAENSALPHGKSTNYKLKKGDSLLFDFGGCHNGYNADITRTFFIGEASDYQRNFYNIVLNANLAAINKCKLNVTLHEVDDTATTILENSHYKNFIIHKTGHGLGLDVHEEPYVGRGNNTSLDNGMVVTIEPGLYNPDMLGVRIEDDVLINNDAPIILTTFSKDLEII